MNYNYNRSYNHNGSPMQACEERAQFVTLGVVFYIFIIMKIHRLTDKIAESQVQSGRTGRTVPLASRLCVVTSLMSLIEIFS